MAIQSTMLVTKTLAVSILLAVGLTACGGTAQNETEQKQGEQNNIEQGGQTVTDGNVTLQTAKGDVEIAINPTPIAVYDMTAMENLTALEVPADGLPNKILIDTMKMANTNPTDIGTVFEPKLEALNAMKPQAIIIGGRMAEKYDELSAIAPTLDLSLDQANLYESSKQRLAELGALFGKTDKASQLQTDIDQAIADTKAVTEGKGNGVIIVVNGNKLSAQSPDSRFGFIHNQFNIPAADPNIKSGGHGQPVSFEYLQKINPDWLFVLDRTAAIGEEGEGAAAVLDNELVKQTTAGSKGQIVYLSPNSYLSYGSYYQWMNDSKIVKEAFEKAE